MTTRQSLTLRTQIAVPYLRAKGQDYYESLGGGIDSDILEDGGSERHIRELTDEVSSTVSR